MHQRFTAKINRSISETKCFSSGLVMNGVGKNKVQECSMFWIKHRAFVRTVCDNCPATQSWGSTRSSSVSVTLSALASNTGCGARTKWKETERVPTGYCINAHSHADGIVVLIKKLQLCHLPRLGSLFRAAEWPRGLKFPPCGSRRLLKMEEDRMQNTHLLPLSSGLFHDYFILSDKSSLRKSWCS